MFQVCLKSKRLFDKFVCSKFLHSFIIWNLFLPKWELAFFKLALYWIKEGIRIKSTKVIPNMAKH